MLDSVQSPQHNPEPILPKRGKFRFWFALIMLILLGGGIFVGSRLVIFAQKIIETKNGPLSFGQLFLGSDKKLTGEDQKEVHILLMGIGGEGHDGPNLTDTMILATLKLPQNSQEKLQVGLFSIPRDLVVNIPGHDFVKINSAFAYGQQDNQNQGAALATQAVENLLDIKIPYYGVLDFQGFKKVVDDVGGVTVNVDRTFTDREYPDEKNGYLPPVTFEAGTQTMDGGRALEYVRSRHGDNGEGTDFARSRRQEKILKALKDKIVNLRVLINLNLMDQILNDIGDHVRTNLQPYEMKRIYDLTKNVNDADIATNSLDVESGILCNQIDQNTGAYILVPCTGLSDYSGIRNLFDSQFVAHSFLRENPTVEIQNAGGDGQILKSAQAKIFHPDLKTTVGFYRGKVAYTQSIIYDNTGGQKLETLQYLKDRLGIGVASGPFPFATSTQNPDFVIILAKNL